MDDKLVRLSDAVSVILEDKISGQQLEIIRLLGDGMQAETLNQACDRHSQYICDLPAVDAVEVVHAKWTDALDYVTYKCSNCLQYSSWDIEGEPYRYCPHCGARMDERREDGAT